MNGEEEKVSVEEKKFRELFEGGRYFLIPAFFKTLMTLKKAKREFAIVFRTMGHDIENVVREFNRYLNAIMLLDSVMEFILALMAEKEILS